MTEAGFNPVEEGVPQTSKRPPAIDALRNGILDRPARAFAVLSIFYFVACAAMSSLKLLWLDELITLHIARLGSVGAIWAALRAGADPNPPITHVLVHASRLVFGEHEFALRLPAMCGYWLGLVLLFAYLRRRLSADWALAGTVLSMTMAAFDYSFESRSYAIFYGFTMAAFYCWTIAADDTVQEKTRVAGILGLALMLMACISTNYFAVLAFLPVSAGEVARTVTRYKASRTGASLSIRLRQAVDLPIWLAIAVAATPLLAYRPLIAHSIAQFAPYAWNKVSIDRATDSYTEMVETILYPLLALFALYGAVRALIWICGAMEGRFRPRVLDQLTTRLRNQPALLPAHEAVGVCFLMAYPFLGYIVASIHGGMMSPRFVIPVCLGFAIAGTVAAYRLVGQLPRAGVVLLCFCLAWFAARESVVGYSYAEQKQSFYRVLESIPQAEAYLPEGAPIAVPDPLMALTLQHYASPAIASRLVFPVDFPAIRKFRKDDSPEQNMWPLRDTIYTLKVMPLAAFQQRTSQYLVLAADRNWLLQDLDRHRYEEHRLPINMHAEDIGGFTPLLHGVPTFSIGTGDLAPGSSLAPQNVPIPFRASANMPDAPDME